MSAVRSAISEALGRITSFLTTKRGVLLLLVLLVVSAGYAVFSYTEHNPESNKFCTVCHNMEPFYQGIEDTPHEAFNCHTCHALSPSVVKELWIQLTEAPSAEEVKERSTVTLIKPCLECHSLSELSEQQIHKAHLGVIDKARSCNICHNPHALNELDLACKDCHDVAETAEKHAEFHDNAIQQLEKGEYTVCGKCHSEAADWEIKIAPDCFTGIIKGQNCFDCHGSPLSPPRVENRQCIECHNAS